VSPSGSHVTVLDHYFCSFAGETFPNRFYQHAARTDRDHNTTTISKLPAIWDQLSPIPNNKGIPTGGYFFRDLPFLALWALKYYPFWHLFAAGDTDAANVDHTGNSTTPTDGQLVPNYSQLGFRVPTIAIGRKPAANGSTTQARGRNGSGSSAWSRCSWRSCWVLALARHT
jgi:hypothetical protein